MLLYIIHPHVLVSEVNIAYLPSKTVEEWLESLNLKELYLETFQKNLFTSMERVCKIWDDELTSILDIEKIGHRKRILLSILKFWPKYIF